MPPNTLLHSTLMVAPREGVRHPPPPPPPPCGNYNDIIGQFPNSTIIRGRGDCAELVLPGVFSGIIGLVPVVFHLAGVQRLPHLAQ